MIFSSQFKLIAVSSLSALLMSGCSFLSFHPFHKDAGQAQHDFDYLDVKPAPALVVPGNLKKPIHQSDYDVPALAKGNAYRDYVGGQVDIRPPQQLVAVVPGELRKSEDGHPQFWLDVPASNSAEATRQWLLNELKQYLSAQGSGVRAINADQSEIQGDWITVKKHIDGGLFSSDDFLFRRKFNYRIAVAQNGRSAMVEPVFVGYQRNPSDPSVTGLAKLHQYNHEMAEINAFLAYEQAQRAQQQLAGGQTQTGEAPVQSASRAVGPIELTMAKDGSATLVADAPLSATLKSLGHSLSILGFKVTNYISESGQLYVTYDHSKHADLDKFGVKPVDLADDDYTFTIGSDDGKTQITVSDDDGVLTESRLEKLYTPLAALLKQGFIGQ